MILTIKKGEEIKMVQGETCIFQHILQATQARFNCFNHSSSYSLETYGVSPV